MSGVLETILMIVLIMLAASAVYAVWAAVGTMRSVSTLADDLDDQLIRDEVDPLLEIGEAERLCLEDFAGQFSEVGIPVFSVYQVRLVVGLLTNRVEAVAVGVHQEQVVIAVLGN